MMNNYIDYYNYMNNLKNIRRYTVNNNELENLDGLFRSWLGGKGNINRNCEHD